MPRGKRKRSPQRCYSCGDPLGDFVALTVTGNESGRIHYVHRHTTRGKELCFTVGVQGVDSHSIARKVVKPYRPNNRADVALALQLGLDKVAAHAVGVDYRAVMARRTWGGRGR